VTTHRPDHAVDPRVPARGPRLPHRVLRVDGDAARPRPRAGRVRRRRRAHLGVRRRLLDPAVAQEHRVDARADLADHPVLRGRAARRRRHRRGPRRDDRGRGVRLLHRDRRRPPAVAGRHDRRLARDRRRARHAPGEAGSWPTPLPDVRLQPHRPQGHPLPRVRQRVHARRDPRRTSREPAGRGRVI
ncbi:MAG: hypothetical protein AVDCRST_MAG64-1364, partial [uncultured Phycisphaerae bacterium]